VVIAATQKPGSDVVPTSLRDLFGYRLAMRCSTAAASDTILGSGWATEGYSAASVDPATRGVGLLLHESGVPHLLRTHWLDDTTVSILAQRAASLRGGSDHDR
jgi:S-DNA-T family DNA segregation ATPase FtsK/SpoIIIE